MGHNAPSSNTGQLNNAESAPNLRFDTETAAELRKLSNTTEADAKGLDVAADTRLALGEIMADTPEEASRVANLGKGTERLSVAEKEAGTISANRQIIADLPTYTAKNFGLQMTAEAESAFGSSAVASQMAAIAAMEKFA